LAERGHAVLSQMRPANEANFIIGGRDRLSWIKQICGLAGISAG
jgi:hypothetical protein